MAALPCLLEDSKTASSVAGNKASILRGMLAEVNEMCCLIFFHLQGTVGSLWGSDVAEGPRRASGPDVLEWEYLESLDQRGTRGCHGGEAKQMKPMNPGPLERYSVRVGPVLGWP